MLIRLGVLAPFVLLAAWAQPSAALEIPISLAQVIASGADAVRALDLADLDGDGDPDALVGSADDGELAWYANDGAGVFGAAQPIATAVGVTGVAAADLDGDGDLDVLRAAAAPAGLAWHANDGAGGFGAAQILSVVETSALAVADLDGEGSPDILAAAPDSSEIFWLANDGSAGFGAPQTLSTAASGASAVAIADLDRDGSLDVLWGAETAGMVAWHANDGSGTFGAAQTIATSAAGVTSVAAVDLDQDGAPDVLIASRFDSTVGWHRNLDGAGSFGLEQAVATLWFAASAVAADLDRDGDPDVLAAGKFGGVFWYQNDGAGAFGAGHAIATGFSGAAAVRVADLDRDGDPDVAAAFEFADEVVWYANEDLVTSARYRPILDVATSAEGAAFVVPSDVDRDGDTDLVSSETKSDGTHEYRWYANDGRGVFSAGALIAKPQGSAGALAVADLDGNGTVDVLAASETPPRALIWFASDGGGGFSALQSIDTFAVGASPSVLRSGDLDRDGDLDIAAGFPAGGLAWYENEDGSGDFGPQIPVPSTIAGETSLELVDFDRDGDLDLVSVGDVSLEVVWFENDGTGTFSTEQLLASGNEFRNHLDVADFDRDGDPDVRFGWSWFESCPDPVCASHAVSTQFGVTAADLDRDGDTDLLTFSGQWAENTNGLGNFPATRRFSGIPDLGSVVLADFDRDGDADIAGTGTNQIRWTPSRAREPVFIDTFDAHPESHLIEGTGTAALSIKATRLGFQPSDPALRDTELASLAVRFEESPGDPLTTAEANALIASLELFKAACSYCPPPGSDDELIAVIEPLALEAGVQTIELPDGASSTAITRDPSTFYITVILTADASDQTPHVVQLTHLGTRAVIERIDLDLPVAHDPGPEVTSTILAVPEGEPGDVDGDQIPDLLDPCPSFFNSTLADLNGDGIPDECQCGDANANNTVDNSDLFVVFACLSLGNPPPCAANLAAGKAEANHNLAFDGNDLTQISAALTGQRQNWQLTCANRPEGTPAP